MRLQPGWLLLGEGIERRTHTLPHAFQAAERAHAGQHRRRIGALLAARFEPAALARQLQDRFQEQVWRSRRQHALAEVRQDRVIEARLIQRQGQRIQPIDARAHRVGDLPIGQPLEGLQHRHQRQPPGGFCGPSPFGKQMGKLLIAVDRPQRVAQLRDHRALGAQSLHQPTRFFRDWLQTTGFQRHWPPLFVFPQGRHAASHWLGSLSLSIPDGTYPLVYTNFPNRVMYRAPTSIVTYRAKIVRTTLSGPLKSRGK
ncbi:MAG TPA: hypothetical protein VF844_06140 [Ktedonobacteraceae bacterium]